MTGQRRPTAKTLGEAFLDLAASWRNDPSTLSKQKAQLIHSFGTRIADRIADDDERLSSFTAHTDRNGYVWMPEGLDRNIADLAPSSSFEKLFTFIAQQASLAPGPGDEELDALADSMERQDRMMADGLRLKRATWREGGETWEVWERP